MHLALTASIENSFRSGFAQFRAAGSENKERCMGITPGHHVRDSDLRSVAMVASQERKESLCAEGTGSRGGSKSFEEHFDAPGEEDWNARYNIAPTQPSR